MDKRVSYKYKDMPMSGRNLFDEKPCHCEKYRRALEDIRRKFGTEECWCNGNPMDKCLTCLINDALEDRQFLTHTEDKKGVCDLTKTYIPSERDYVEDFKDEDNGKYFYTCEECKMNYLAHKHRRPVICRACSDKEEAVPKLTEEVSYGGVTICPKCHRTAYMGKCSNCDAPAEEV